MTSDRPPSPGADFLDMHHRQAPLVIANVWDAGSARILEQVGFTALATTSAGISFAAGQADGSLTRSAMLDQVARIVEAVGCPVTADLESGYGTGPADVGATITEALSIGLVGANLEDSMPGAASLFGLDEAVERLTAARQAAPAGGFVLNARIDTYLIGPGGAVEPDKVFDETVERAERYVAAGADCVYVPGVADPAVIGRLVAAVPAPLNVVAGLTSPVLDVATLRSLGVSRISIGGSLARAVFGFIERAGQRMLADGTFDFVADAIAHGDLQQRLGTAEPTASEQRN